MPVATMDQHDCGVEELGENIAASYVDISICRQLTFPGVPHRAEHRIVGWYETIWDGVELDCTTATQQSAVYDRQHMP